MLPSTLPASSTRTGTAATRISTIRLCFSSTTLCAIAIPKRNVVRKNRNANAVLEASARSVFFDGGSSSRCCGAASAAAASAWRAWSGFTPASASCRATASDAAAAVTSARSSEGTSRRPTSCDPLAPGAGTERRVDRAGADAGLRGRGVRDLLDGDPRGGGRGLPGQRRALGLVGRRLGGVGGGTEGAGGVGHGGGLPTHGRDRDPWRALVAEEDRQGGRHRDQDEQEDRRDDERPVADTGEDLAARDHGDEGRGAGGHATVSRKISARVGSARRNSCTGPWARAVVRSRWSSAQRGQLDQRPWAVDVEHPETALVPEPAGVPAQPQVVARARALLAQDGGVAGGVDAATIDDHDVVAESFDEVELVAREEHRDAGRRAAGAAARP